MVDIVTPLDSIGYVVFAIQVRQKMQTISYWNQGERMTLPKCTAFKQLRKISSLNGVGISIPTVGWSKQLKEPSFRKGNIPFAIGSFFSTK